MNYDDWIMEIDDHLLYDIGVTSYQLDKPFQEWFEQGLEPTEVLDLIKSDEKQSDE